jgi:hypothetical protein
MATRDNKTKDKIIAPQEGFQEKFVESNIDVVFGGGAAGVGKGHPLDAQVVTPFGMRRFGDLKVGNIISGTDGGMQRVIGVYELGEQDIYEFTFVDGAKSECTLDHLWNVKVSKNISKKRRLNGGDYDLDWRVMTAEQVMAWMDRNKDSQSNLLVPLSNPIQFTRSCTSSHCPIDPYILGLLIGDGSIVTNQIQISTADKEIVDSFESITGLKLRHRAKYDYTVEEAGDLIKGLKQLKLLGTRSHTKFIPTVYKVRSIEYRLSIIQGLFDTDGFISKDGRIVYTTTSEQLAEDIQWIIRSLGGKATINKAKAGYKDKDGIYIQCKDAYDVYVNIKNSENLFRLKRKKERCNNKFNGGDHLLNRRIIGYRYIGKKEARCIAVSNPNSLYLTNDFIVTHNTSAAVLAIAYYVGNPNYRALYVRKNLGELKGGGSMPEEFAKLYPEPLIARTTMSDNPEIEFVSGCKVVMTHMANENIHDITERVKGWQYDFIYMDELTAYQWNTFAYLMSRNRGSSGEKPLFRGTTNPKRNSWVRKFIDWYVDEDGFIDPLRDGVVRYFYYAGGTVEDVIWGDTPDEVYVRCKERIDRQMKASKTEHLSPYDLIKSFTFYSGKLGDNKILLKDQPQYVGNLAMAGGTQAAQLLEGNWNVDMEEDSESLIYPQHMDNLFDNDYQITEKKYITVDIALQGDDNLVAMVWYGFHIKDIVVLSGTITPPEAINAVQLLQQKHDIGNYNIIYDSIGVGSFFSGFFSGAVAFNSNFTPSKAGKARFSTLKAECAHKLSEMLDARAISIEKNLLDRIYKHKNAKESRTIRQELIRESKVLIPKVSNNGKIGLITKKEMGAMLGKGNSPDLLDPMILRMYPDLDYVPNGIVPTGDTYMQGKDDIHIDLEDFFNNEW